METNAPNLQWDNVCMMDNSRMETQEGLNASSFFLKKSTVNMLTEKMNLEVSKR